MLKNTLLTRIVKLILAPISPEIILGGAHFYTGVLAIALWLICWVWFEIGLSYNLLSICPPGWINAAIQRFPELQPLLNIPHNL